MKWFASILREDLPTESEMATMNKSTAAGWIHERWRRWVTESEQTQPQELM
jgi:hypothetical protein